MKIMYNQIIRTKQEVAIMRKIIKGIAYDTKTATYIGKENLSVNGKLNELYKKRSGEFFLQTVRVKKFWAGGKEADPLSITPISVDEAKEWIEQNLSAKEYEEVFGEVSKDDSRVATTITLTHKNYDKLKELALEAKKPVSKFLDEVIGTL